MAETNNEYKSKNLIIGGASNYKYEDLEPWVNSILATGYDGDIVLVATNMKNEDLEKLAKKGVQFLLYGTMNGEGEYRHSVRPDSSPHVDRFFYIWEYLQANEEKYDRVVVTDVRDVIFQRNPFDTEVMHFGGLIAAGEGLQYKDEPWGKWNIYQALGQFFGDRLVNLEIMNVGVIAGGSWEVQGAMLAIYLHGSGRGVADQAVWNHLLYEHMMGDAGLLSMDSDWVCNLGTTIHAIEAGAGDLGVICTQVPAKMEAYKEAFLYDQPIITEEGRVCTKYGHEYAIVHQYDRVPKLKDAVLKRYKDV